MGGSRPEAPRRSEEPGDGFSVVVLQPELIYQLAKNLSGNQTEARITISESHLDGETLSSEYTTLVIEHTKDQGPPEPMYLLESRIHFGEALHVDPNFAYYPLVRIQKVQELLKDQGVDSNISSERNQNVLVHQFNEGEIRFNFGFDDRKTERQYLKTQYGGSSFAGILATVFEQDEIEVTLAATSFQNSAEFRNKILLYAKIYEEFIRALYHEQEIHAPDNKIVLRPVVISGDTTEEIQSLSKHETEIISPEQIQTDSPTLDEVQGQTEAVREARRLIAGIRDPDLYESRGAKRPKGILLWGPPGTGKTMLVRAISREADATFMSISLPQIVTKWYGESARLMQKVFDRANEEVLRGRKVILFIDEIDALAPPRGQAFEATKMIVSVLLQNLDGLQRSPDVTFICASNSPDNIDSALKRSGRIDKLIEVGLPKTTEDITSILEVHINRAKKRAAEKGNADEIFDLSLDLLEVAQKAVGMSGADLENLVNESLRLKTDAEVLDGIVWAPVSTKDLIKTIDLLRLAKEDKRKIGFLS